MSARESTVTAWQKTTKNGMNGQASSVLFGNQSLCAYHRLFLAHWKCCLPVEVNCPHVLILLLILHTTQVMGFERCPGCIHAIICEWRTGVQRLVRTCSEYECEQRKMDNVVCASSKFKVLAVKCNIACLLQLDLNATKSETLICLNSLVLPRSSSFAR